MMYEGVGMHLVSENLKPKLTGEARDWISFVREWEEYLSLMKEACPNTFTDPLKLNLLKGCLDKSSQTHLQWCRERNPTITYKDCWAELSGLHGYDVAFQNRKVCQGVRLE